MVHPASPDRAIRPPGRAWRPQTAQRVPVAAQAVRRWLASHARLWRYGLPVLFVAVAFLSRERLLPEAGDKSPFQTFVLAALLSALAGGLGPGLLATALGAALAIYLYLPPFHELAIDTGSDAVRLGLFLLEGLVSAVAGEAVRRATSRERTLSQSAERFRRFLGEAARSRSLPGDDEVQLVEALSDRELEVVRLLALGLRNDEISERLFVTRNTVKTHLSHIYGKLGVRTRTEAVGRCIALGLLAEPGQAAAEEHGGPAQPPASGSAGR